MSPVGDSGHRRCSYRLYIRLGMPRQTLVKPSASSVASSARSTSSLLTCHSQTPASGLAIRQRRRKAFCDGHVQAFAFFGGVLKSEILYDNTKIAVARILGDGKRQRTRVFTELQSHLPVRGSVRPRPGKVNDKGKVEGLVGYARRNFLVPIPVFESFEALNAHLLECCRRRMADCLRGHDGTIGERLGRDFAAFQTPLPAPYDACEKIGTTVSSLSLVRYRLNDYSVPTTYGHRDVLVRGYVHEGFDFAAIPSLNKTLVLELARSEYITRRENIIAVGNSGTGKTHIGLGLGLAACQKGLSVGFYTAAALVHELLGGAR